MANEESGQDRFIRCNIKNTTIMMGNKTPLSLCFNDVVSKAFSSSNFSHIFFSLNAVLAFCDFFHFIVKLNRVSAWTGKRERGMTR